MSSDTIAIPLSEMESLSIFKSLKTSKNVGEVSDLNLMEFKKGLMNCVFSGCKNMPEEIMDYPPNYFELDVSSYVKTDDQVNGVFLVHKNQDAQLEIKLMHANGPDYAKNLVYMIRNAYASALEYYPADTEVAIPLRSDEAIALIRKLFPGRI